MTFTTAMDPKELPVCYIDAISRRDFGALGKLWTPDARWQAPGISEVSGIENVLALLESMSENVTFAFQGILGNIVRVDGDVGVGRCYIEERGRYTDGNDFTINGYFDDQLKLVDGRWLFASRKFNLLYRRISPSEGKFYRHTEWKEAFE